MKRSISSHEIPSSRKVSGRYLGRSSFPKIQSHHRKKLKPRQKSARLSDYLEEFDEFSQESGDYQDMASTSASSNDIHDSRFMSTESPSPSKEITTKFDHLRYQIKLFAEENIPDSLAVNTQETTHRQKKFGSYMWLNLQAILANRQMSKDTIQHSLDVQHHLLKKMRDEKASVLQDIAQFSIKQSHNPDLSWIKAVYDRDYMNLLHESHLEVGRLLDRYDAFYSLFPNHRAMTESAPITTEIQNRVQNLYLWYNSLADLNEKIHQISSYFDFLNDVKRKSSFVNMPRTSSSSSNSSFSKLDRVWPRFSEASEDISMESIDDEIMTLCDQSHDSIANEFASMYSTVVSRSLRLRGMLVILNRLDRICLLSAEKIWSCFLRQRYSDVVSNTSSTETLFSLYKPEPKQKLLFSDQCIVKMNLPSFFYLFLFFIKVPVDLLNQWLQMRSERVKTTGLDLMTLNTLIEDSHDCLKMAIETKTRFKKIVQTTCQNPEDQIAYLQRFDDNFDVVFQNYLSYLRSWAKTINPLHNSDIELCEKLVSKLKKEWSLSKNWAGNVIRGECTAAKRFCTIANDLFDNVNRFLTERFDHIDHDVLENNFYDEDFMIEDFQSINNNSTVLVLCRELKQMTRNLRERALKALMFLKDLCSDLDICSRYKWNAEYLENVNDFVKQLLSQNHVMLAPSKIDDCSFVILCPIEIVRETAYIDNLLNATFSHNSTLPTGEHSLNTTTGYVVLIPSNWVSSELRNRSNQAHISLSMNTRLNLSHSLTLNSIILVSDSGENLQKSRSKFERCIKNYLSNHLILIDDCCSCNDQISEELTQAKDSAFNVGKELWSHANDLKSYILNGREEDALNQIERDKINSTLLQAYSCAFEYYKELSKITSKPMRQEFYHEIVECLSEWSDFVLKTLVVIRKTTPVWFLAPLSYFLSLPFKSFEIYLNEADKDRFVRTVDKCLNHLNEIVQKDKDSVVHKTKQYYNTRLSDGINNLNLDEYYIIRKTSFRDRICQKLDELDRNFDNNLRAEGKIGTVIEVPKRYDFANLFGQRKAPFEWQRLENKFLGRGSFGSVYLVMNLTSNCLMAMKQMHVPLDNNSGLKAIAEELINLSKLSHPNLIKYYGVEVHADELMIFMEYCSEGTLARVCREKLDLVCARRYTHYLLAALSYLHEHSIVHRDVKPANIFLGQKNVLKLGDFGCSFRLEGTSTRIGELVTFSGTTVYSAPELHTCGGLQTTANFDSQQPMYHTYRGYGRAVDIWSVGCTVLEMLTGRKPYYYLEHEFQIIFQLGCGIPPKIPPEIQKCELSNSFLSSCFIVDPEQRPDAQTLLQHSFVNIVANLEQESQDLNALGFSQSQASSQINKNRAMYRR